MPRTLADGRYELGLRLASGATATVYRATDTVLGVVRAVKILEGPAGQGVRHRFAREARLLQVLRHRNVVRVHDVGAEGDLPWLVMDLVEGGSADRLLADGPLPPERVVAIGLDLLAGLEAAHHAGIVHRDVKPQNVLLGAAGAVLADFGVARELGGSVATATGQGVGTVGFMAPEQRRGARDVDRRADLYGVGATLYTLATGDPPEDLYVREREREVWGRVPQPLRSVLRRATRFEPERRYASAAEMAEALRGPARSSRLRVAAGVGLAGLALSLIAMAIAPEDEPPAEVVSPVSPRALVLPEPTPVPVPASTAPPPTPPRAPPPSGRLFVNSIPPGEVRVDGVARGTTPVEVEAPAGPRRVEVENGRGRVVRTVDVEAGQKASLCWDFATDEPCSRR